MKHFWARGSLTKPFATIASCKGETRIQRNTASEKKKNTTPGTLNMKTFEKRHVPSSCWGSFLYKVGPLPVINGVITPISRVITPVTHL